MVETLHERVKRARDLYARLCVENPEYLPLFEAFDRDLVELDARNVFTPHDRARQRVQRLREMAELA